MLTLGAHVSVFVCKEPVRMHKSFEGLSAIVQKLFPEQLFSGSLFIFLNRNRTHMKVLIWDRDGCVIYYKRLEKGSFARIQQHALHRRELFMLLEGIEPKKIRSRLTLKN